MQNKLQLFFSPKESGVKVLMNSRVEGLLRMIYRVWMDPGDLKGCYFDDKILV